MESAPTISEGEKEFSLKDLFETINAEIDERSERRPDSSQYYSRMRELADITSYKRCTSKHQVIGQIDEEVRFEHSKGARKDQEKIDALVDISRIIKGE